MVSVARRYVGLPTWTPAFAGEVRWMCVLECGYGLYRGVDDEALRFGVEECGAWQGAAACITTSPAKAGVQLGDG